MRVHSLGYLGFQATDPSQWSSFGTDILGLEDVSQRCGLTDAVALKIDSAPWRMIALKGDSAKLAFCGWETGSSANFDAAINALKTAGITVTVEDAQRCKERLVSGLASFTDPSGNAHELYWGRHTDLLPMNSPLGIKRFVTGDMGLGHVVLPATEFDATAALFMDHLGFEVSDTMTIRFSDDPAEPPKRLWFMHCNSRHHSLALFEMANPEGCIHAMIELDDADEVGRAYDRVAAAGVPLAATLGRHANDGMFSFYVKTPSGFAMEYGAEGMRVDDWDAHPVYESTVTSLWGHDFTVGMTPDA